MAAGVCLWGYAGRGGAIPAEVQTHAARAEAAERRAQTAARSAAAAHRHADSLRAELEVLAADTVRMAEDLRRARSAAHHASREAERARARFDETGSLDDCADALTSCTASRRALAEVVEEQDTLLVTQAAMLLIASAETMQLRSAYDSVAVALGHSSLAIEEQRLAAGAALGLASRYRRERNVALAAGGAIALILLVTR